MIANYQRKANSASILAFFVACLATTVAFRAGPLIAAFVDLAFWPLLPEEVLNSRVARFLLRAVAVTVVALAGLLLPLEISNTRKAIQIEASANATRQRARPTPFEVLTLLFALQFAPIVTAAVGEKGDEVLLGVYAVIATVIVVLGVSSHRARVVRIPTARGMLLKLLAGTAMAAIVAGGTLLFSYAIDRSPGPPVTTFRSVEALILAPLILEYVYRAGAQRIIGERARPIGGILASGLCFALYHESLGVFSTAIAFSVLVGVAYSVSGQLLIAVAAHSLTNVGELFRDRLVAEVVGVFPDLTPMRGLIVVGFFVVLIRFLARSAGYRAATSTGR